MSLKIAKKSTAIRLPSGRMKLVDQGEVIDADVYQHMSEEAIGRILIDWDGTELDPDPDYEEGTADDPRLTGAPSSNAKVDTIMEWVGDDPVRGVACYERELRKTKQRPSLMTALAAIID